MPVLKTVMSYTHVKDPKTESYLFESMKAQGIMPEQRLGAEDSICQKHCTLDSVELIGCNCVVVWLCVISPMDSGLQPEPSLYRPFHRIQPSSPQWLGAHWSSGSARHPVSSADQMPGAPLNPFSF
jgi:hypothetical protein